MNSLLMNSLLVAGLVSTASSDVKDDVSNAFRDKFVFLETFDDGKDVFETGRWVKSDDEKYKGQPVMIKGVNSAPDSLKSDLGLELTQENKFYGVGAPFALNFKGKDIVAQYEFNAEKLECGGAYIKLPRVGSEAQFSDLNADSPYSIMFGPDKCGPTAKVHFIVQYMNPVTQNWEEKHLIEPPAPRVDRNTHLYTLHVKPDSTFEIFIDKESVKTGSLLTDMNPPINPPENIDDPSDIKPDDWVDEKEIPDPDAEKPADWDEDAPLMIEDPDDHMPSEWQVDAPLKIPDPDAARPDDWDDEEDGIWEAPEIPNPVCEAAGCGPWTRAKKQNPDYKGPWKPPMIPNPLYKGEWKPKQIPNPEYFEHKNPVDHLAPIDGAFIEVWTTNNAFHFDNFVFGHSIEDAFSFAKETFDVKSEIEKKHSKAKDKEAVDSARQKKLEQGGFINMIEVYFAVFTDFIMEQNPVTVAATLLALFVAAVLLIIKGSSNLTPEEVTETEHASEKREDDKEEVEEEEAETLPDVVETVEDELEPNPKPKKSPKGTTAKRRSRRTGD